MSKQKNPISFINKLKIALAGCAGIVAVVSAALYLQPKMSNYFDKNHIMEKSSEIKKTTPPSQAGDDREYLYEIEFVSGGRAYSENVVATTDINTSWSDLRKQLEGQSRVTVTLKQKDGNITHIRKSTRPELRQQKIYSALGLTSLPDKTIKTEIEAK